MTTKMSFRCCVVAFLVLGIAISGSFADTPANCTYADIQGSWIFQEGERSGNSGINCSSYKGPTVNVIKLELQFPNIAVDELGNEGYWTIVYNQGFEVVINYRRYFGFSAYEKKGSNVTSYCDTVSVGWSHDVLGKNWACFSAKKNEQLIPKTHFEKELLHDAYFYNSQLFVRHINKIQDSWKATVYPEHNGMLLEDIVRRSGGIRSRIHSPPKPAPVSRDVAKLASSLPEDFDWRNVSGINYVSDVRNQGQCGSCYAFSSMAMLEARLRVVTKNGVQEVFSPQDIVSCSEYSQGCEGGFPYLIAGKYAQDFGVVPEQCNPYTGKDDACNEKPCKRYYVADFNYIGGFYGGCNEELMKLELVKNGPIAVSFEVYPDFQNYRGGIYHHTGLRSGFNPFMITNHAVLAVGYGVEKSTNEKYWIVKNSWGESWGESGYFRIRRGTNECSIESIAVAAFPIP